MATFESTLITAIVASLVSVLAFLALTLVIALYWTSIARRIAPNRFAEPLSEKAWPSLRNSTEVESAAMLSNSPRSSPISSQARSLSRIIEGDGTDHEGSGNHYSGEHSRLLVYHLEGGRN
ncbi:hypothetical protein F5X97DRAFT_319502 [Nemania serpens]|nr:hypothetical protein F5X97DRAFT_319502 [Nemania serpens]